MKIVVDSGSTKADWIVFDKEHQCSHSFATLGMNPEVLTEEELENRMKLHPDIQQIKNQVNRIFFYGSGCGTPRSKELVMSALKKIFINAGHIDVREDTYAAVYATVQPKEQAIVCINGTGSNCSYFDGEQVIQEFYSLGYVIMDDFSGSNFGKAIIKSYFLKTMPEDLRNQLEKSFEISADLVKEHLFKKPNPNAYLASFTSFLLDYKRTDFFQQMIHSKIQYFIDHYIKLYEPHKKVPVHFVGSVAYFFQEELKHKLKENGLQCGKIIQKPLDGLIASHKQ